MPKLKDMATNPLTGKKIDLSLMGVLSMVLGVVVMLFVVSTGQKTAQFVEQKTAGRIDTSPSQFIQQQKVVSSEVVL